LPNEIETALYRIAQESLTNAVRHGRAARVWIGLRLMPTSVTLTIIDDGGGFVVRRAPGAASQINGYGGMGFEGMRERARAVGGTLIVRSRPGHGTIVRATALVPTSGPGCAPARSVRWHRPSAISDGRDIGRPEIGADGAAAAE
jgi:two-component system NarL family sensor kinase